MECFEIQIILKYLPMQIHTLKTSFKPESVHTRIRNILKATNCTALVNKRVQKIIKLHSHRSASVNLLERSTTSAMSLMASLGSAIIRKLLHASIQFTEGLYFCIQT